jgi:hypothetical protein
LYYIHTAASPPATTRILIYRCVSQADADTDGLTVSLRRLRLAPGRMLEAASAGARCWKLHPLV